MFGEVDQLRSLPYPADRGFLNGFSLADQRDHAAVVIGVHLAIQQKNAGNLHRLDNGINLGLVAAFGKIRNAFHQSAWHTRRIKDDANSRKLGSSVSVVAQALSNRKSGAPNDLTSFCQNMHTARIMRPAPRLSGCGFT